MEPVLSICCPRIHNRFRESFVFFVFLLPFSSFFAFFLLLFFLGRATAAAPKSEAAVDGNRKEVADRVASLQAGLGNKERNTMLLVLPLCSVDDVKRVATHTNCCVTLLSTPSTPLESYTPAGRGEAACLHDLSRRLLRVKTSYELVWRLKYK